MILAALKETEPTAELQWEAIFLTHWHGTLYYENEDYERGEAGTITCLQIHRCNVIDKDLSESGGYWKLLDELGEEEAEFGAFLDKIRDQYMFDDIDQNDCLRVRRIHVKEKYKGLWLGFFMLDVADKVINSPMSMLALIPCPVDALGVPVKFETEHESKAAKAKLVDYYKLINIVK